MQLYCTFDKSEYRNLIEFDLIERAGHTNLSASWVGQMCFSTRSSTVPGARITKIHRSRNPHRKGNSP